MKPIKKLKKMAEDAFEDCISFRTACLEMSMQAINSRAVAVKSQTTTQNPSELVGSATAYIFAEIPFYLCSAELLGVRTSVLAYHRAWPIGDMLSQKNFPLRVDKRQGHGIVSMMNETPIVQLA